MSRSLQTCDHRQERLFDGGKFLPHLGVRIIVGALARLAEDEQAGVDPHLVHEPGDGDGDVAALVVDVGDQRHVMAAPPHLGLDLAQAVRLGQSRRGDAHDLAAGLVHLR